MTTSRFRERGELVPADIFNIDYVVQSTDGTVSTNTVNQIYAPSVGTWQGMRDVVTPRFKEQSARGAIFNNHMFLHKIERELSAGSFGYTKPGTPYDYTADFGEYYKGYDNQPSSVRPGPVTIDSNVQALAATAALADIDSLNFKGLYLSLNFVKPSDSSAILRRRSLLLRKRRVGPS